CSASASARRWSGSACSSAARIGMAERLANKLKDRRSELGLTQAELAERVGVTRKTVNTVENGVFTPSATLAIKLARALGLNVEQLFWIEP
ncbi:MAG: helix-turn-helix transcriptional regulator, partial [Sphingomicrobium sp.]